MIEDDGGILSPFLKDLLMWFGFLIPFSLLGMTGLNHYFPQVPVPNLYSYTNLFGPGGGGLEFLLNFMVIGLVYFLSLDVSLSIWLFHVLVRLQMGIESLVGHQIPGEIEIFMEGTLTVAHQGMGAMVALVLYGLFLSRGHLKAVARMVWFNSDEIDDSEEILSYRTATLVLGICTLYVIGWLHMSGMPLWVSVVFLAVAFSIFYGLSRIIAEGGIGFTRSQMTAQSPVINFIGTDAVTDPGIVSMAFTYSWAGNLRVLVMGSVINSMKMAERVGVLRRPLFWAIMLAIVVSLFSSILLIIWLAVGTRVSIWKATSTSTSARASPILPPTRSPTRLT